MHRRSMATRPACMRRAPCGRVLQRLRRHVDAGLLKSALPTAAQRVDCVRRAGFRARSRRVQQLASHSRGRVCPWPRPATAERSRAVVANPRLATMTAVGHMAGIAATGQVQR